MGIRDFSVPCEMPLTGGKIAFVGEAPGAEEMEQLRPFAPARDRENAGVLFEALLRDAAIIRSECLITNLFSFRLPGNKVNMICGRKKQMPKGYPFPAIAPGSYLPPEYFDQLLRLKAELELVKPNIIVPLGNTAMWAVCGVTGITKYRGAVTESSPMVYEGENLMVEGAKVIPTFHPAAILRVWDWRVITLADLMKINTQSESPEILRPSRELWIEPTVKDLLDWESLYVKPDTIISTDIETNRKHRLITCMSFAADKRHGICVPFLDRRKEDYNYWPDIESELAAWKWCKHMLSGPHKKLGQHLLYDVQWLWTEFRIQVKNVYHDLMFMHHALQPEMEKSLGFMGSIYTGEVAWKLMRPKGEKGEADKQDE